MPPAYVMLKGPAPRLQFGDPALIVADGLTDPPFKVAVAEDGKDALHITATLTNPSLRSTFTDNHSPAHTQSRPTPNFFRQVLHRPAQPAEAATIPAMVLSCRELGRSEISRKWLFMRGFAAVRTSA